MTATAPARPLVSASIIVRDEAELLRRCLASVAPWCDEIVVVDTGSTDHSVEVARSFGATVGTFPWTGDFADARNHALDLCTGEWIVYVDADEWFEPLTREQVAAELASMGDAVTFLLWRKDRPGFSPFREYRLWRHRSDVRFVGRIHETMVPDLMRITRDEGLPVPESDVFRMHHDGYEGDQTAKHRRNLPLLEQRVRELPHRVYLWAHLGRVRDGLGDSAGAVEAWRQGVEVVRRFGVIDIADVVVYSDLAEHGIARREDMTALLDEIEMLAPDFHSVRWLRARNERVQGRPEGAVAPLRELLAIGPDALALGMAYDNRMFAESAWEALAEVLLLLGDRAGAAAVWAEASAARPERTDYRVKSRALGGALALQQPGAREG